ATVNIQHAFMQAPFAAGDLATAARWIADPQVSSGNPPVDVSFSANIAPGATVAVVVWCTNAPPQAQGAQYQVLLDQDAFCGPPAPSMGANGSNLTAEGCSPGNGALDPAETVTVSFNLKN